MQTQYARTSGVAILSILLGACSSPMAAPGEGERDGLSARLVRGLNTVVVADASDSTLAIGDSAEIKVNVLDVQTRRDITHRSRITYTLTDTTQAVMTRPGMVRARGRGTPLLIVQSGRSADTIALVTGVVASLPGEPDTLPPTPPPVAPPSAGQPSFSAPILPAAVVDTRMPAVTRTIRVPAGDMEALQAAVNAARAGDEIVLPDGSVYRGNLVMPRKRGGYTILRSETVPAGAGTRTTPSLGSRHAVIETTNSEAAIQFGPGASGWRLVGLTVRMGGSPVTNYGIVRIGLGTETDFNELPSEIILDRTIVQGHPTISTSRCVSFNGNSLAVIDSWLADCHARGRDSQGIGGWNGAGPFLIENNHIEGAGQAVMFGGADPAVRNLTPSDIILRRNHFYKPTSWAGRWTIKAAFELKHARRVLFEGNIIENHWADAQVGFAILLSAVSQDNSAPWSKVWDVTIRNNLIQNSTGGLNILSRWSDANWITIEPSRRLLIQNNLFANVGRDPITGHPGRVMQLLSDMEDVTLLNNTFTGGPAALMSIFDGAPMTRLVLWGNVFPSAEYGLMGSGASEGAGALAMYAPGAVVGGNVFTGRLDRYYPTGNYFPPELTNAHFVAPTAGNYELRPDLPFASHGGHRVGVVHESLRRAIANVASGR